MEVSGRLGRHLRFGDYRAAERNLARPWPPSATNGRPQGRNMTMLPAHVVYFRRLENATLDRASESVKALFHSAENQERYKRIKTLQSATGLSVGAMVLGYLLSQPFPVFANIGPKTVADLFESIEAAKATLSAENLAFLTGQH